MGPNAVGSVTLIRSGLGSGLMVVICAASALASSLSTSPAVRTGTGSRVVGGPSVGSLVLLAWRRVAKIGGTQLTVNPAQLQLYPVDELMHALIDDLVD